jgi:hypothetical protein
MNSLHRVLVVHNAYQQAGGEDAVVQAEIDMLRRRGHPVNCLLVIMTWCSNCQR